MRNRLEVIGLIVTLFISGITLLNWWPKEIGYASLAIAFILCIHLSFEEGKSRCRRESMKGFEIEEGKGQIVFVVKEGDKKELKRQSWGGFTRAEASELRAALLDMVFKHGHPDEFGLVEALKRGEPLNGPCWRCGKPRFQLGGPSMEGENRPDDK